MLFISDISMGVEGEYSSDLYSAVGRGWGGRNQQTVKCNPTNHMKQDY